VVVLAAEAAEAAVEVDNLVIKKFLGKPTFRCHVKP